jgi:hypothetical protein
MMAAMRETGKAGGRLPNSPADQAGRARSGLNVDADYTLL